MAEGWEEGHQNPVRTVAQRDLLIDFFNFKCLKKKEGKGKETGRKRRKEREREKEKKSKELKRKGLLSPLMITPGKMKEVKEGEKKGG